MSLNQDSDKKILLIDRIIELIVIILDGRLSSSGKSESSLLVNGHSCDYLYSITRVDLGTIILHENLISRNDRIHTSRNWIFSNNHKWTISSAEKNGEIIDSRLIDMELRDALLRLENLQTGKTPGLHIPVSGIKQGIIPSDFAAKKINNLALLIAAAVLVCGFFTALIFNSFGYSRISRIVNSLDQSIDASTDRNRDSIDQLSGVIRDVQGELAVLQNSVAQEKEAFFFSRQNTASNIRRMARELPTKYDSRKKAYEFIAICVESAATYGDLIYQVSRLPQNENQAETLLATDVNNVKTLDTYNFVFPDLVYPVRLDNMDNDGKSFMVSSVFMERRLNPIGTGGVRPHFAMDIINISNIIDITPGNRIIRASEIPGSIVSITDGTIREIHYDSVYGWNVEIEHIMTDGILDKYPDAVKWSSFYAHMNKPTGWSEGDEINQNEKVGDIGETGRSTGPHLHFEIRIYRSGGKETGRLGAFDKINPMVEKTDKLKE